MNRFGWKESALTVLSRLAHEKEFLTSDDLHDAAGDPPRCNQMGDAIRTGEQLRIIVPTGRYVKSRRPSAKSRTVKIFRSGFLGEPTDTDPVQAYLSQPSDSPQGSLL